MTVWSARQVAGFFVEAGGPDNLAVAWTAVSFGESDFDDEAVSPVGATGLWQFMPGSWPEQCGSFANATNPQINAQACVILSGGGVNFAPWDSCYTDIEKSGRLQFLAWPQVGSADYNNIPIVSSMLGGHYRGGMVPPTEPGITGTLPDALNWYARTSGSVLPRIQARTRAYSAAAARLY